MKLNSSRKKQKESTGREIPATTSILMKKYIWMSLCEFENDLVLLAVVMAALSILLGIPEVGGGALLGLAFIYLSIHLGNHIVRAHPSNLSSIKEKGGNK